MNDNNLINIPAITGHVFTLKEKAGQLVRWQYPGYPKAGLIWRTEDMVEDFRRTIVDNPNRWRVRRLSPGEVKNMIQQDGGIYLQLETERFGFIPKVDPLVAAFKKSPPIPIHQHLPPHVMERAKVLWDKIGPVNLDGSGFYLLGQSYQELLGILCCEPYPAKELSIMETVCDRALARVAAGEELLAALSAELQISVNEHPPRRLTPEEIDTIRNLRDVPSHIPTGQHRHSLNQQRFRDN
jgi:hypothetical protein